jgi:hypothetical protein
MISQEGLNCDLYEISQQIADAYQCSAARRRILVEPISIPPSRQTLYHPVPNIHSSYSDERLGVSLPRPRRGRAAPYVRLPPDQVRGTARRGAGSLFPLAGEPSPP